MNCWVRKENVCTTLNDIKNFLAFDFAVTIYVSISDFVYLMNISKEIMNSTIELNIFGNITKDGKV